MAFHFSLEAILQLRSRQERAESAKLEAIALEQRQVRARLEELTESSIRSQRRLQRNLREGLDGAELQFQDTLDLSMAAALATLQERLAALEKRRQEQLQVLFRVRQGREIIEKLRAGQLAEYDLIHARKEQQEQDDIFLLRLRREAAPE